EDDLNYLLTFPLPQKSASWYVAAAWDQEGMNNNLAFGSPAHKPVMVHDHSSALKTQKDFLNWLEQRKSELAAPATIKFLQ
ncbi:MAG TPA: hypothetical protein VLK33_21940, partial [Terriglobales bacterium]|nr:hypothetical protein [Terriglobales bacterium]